MGFGRVFLGQGIRQQYNQYKRIKWHVRVRGPLTLALSPIGGEGFQGGTRSRAGGEGILEKNLSSAGARGFFGQGHENRWDYAPNFLNRRA